MTDKKLKVLTNIQYVTVNDWARANAATAAKFTTQQLTERCITDTGIDVAQSTMARILKANDIAPMSMRRSPPITKNGEKYSRAYVNANKHRLTAMAIQHLFEILGEESPGYIADLINNLPAREIKEIPSE